MEENHLAKELICLKKTIPQKASEDFYNQLQEKFKEPVTEEVSKDLVDFPKTKRIQSIDLEESEKLFMSIDDLLERYQNIQKAKDVNRNLEMNETHAVLFGKDSILSLTNLTTEQAPDMELADNDDKPKDDETHTKSKDNDICIKYDKVEYVSRKKDDKFKEMRKMTLSINDVDSLRSDASPPTKQRKKRSLHHSMFSKSSTPIRNRRSSRLSEKSK